MKKSIALLTLSFLCSVNCGPELQVELYALANSHVNNNGFLIENLRIDAFTKIFDPIDDDLCKEVTFCRNSPNNGSLDNYLTDIYNKTDTKIKMVKLIENYAIRYSKPDTETVIKKQIDGFPRKSGIPSNVNNNLSYKDFICQMFGKDFMGKVKWMYHYKWRHGLTQKEMWKQLIPTGDEKQLIWSINCKTS